MVHLANPVLVMVTVKPRPTGEICTASGVVPANTWLISTEAPLGSDVMLSRPGSDSVITNGCMGPGFESFDLGGAEVLPGSEVASTNGTVPVGVLRRPMRGGSGSDAGAGASV